MIYNIRTEEGRMGWLQQFLIVCMKARSDVREPLEQSLRRAVDREGSRNPAPVLISDEQCARHEPQLFGAKREFLPVGAGVGERRWKLTFGHPNPVEIAGEIQSRGECSEADIFNLLWIVDGSQAFMIMAMARGLKQWRVEDLIAA